MSTKMSNKENASCKITIKRIQFNKVRRDALQSLGHQGNQQEPATSGLKDMRFNNQGDKGNVLVHGETSSKIPIKRFPSSEVHRDPLKYLSQQGNQKELKLKVRLTSPTKAKRLMSNKGIMSNKENVVREKSASKIPIKRIPSKERQDPLKSLGQQGNQQEPVPISGLKEVVNKGNVLVHGETSSKIPIKRFPSSEVHRDPLKCLSQQGNQKELKLKVRLTSPTKAKRLMSNKGIMSNKENVVRGKSASKIPIKRIPSKERRDPLKSLGQQGNQQEPVPISGLKEVVNKGNVLVHGETSSKIPIKRFPSSEVHRDPLKCLSQQGNQKELKLKVRLTSPTKAKRLMSNKGIMSNKENVVRGKSASKIPIKRIPSKERRDPLKSLGQQGNQQEPVPISGLKDQGDKDIGKDSCSYHDCQEGPSTSTPNETVENPLNKRIVGNIDKEPREKREDNKTRHLKLKPYREADIQHPIASRRAKDMRHVTMFRGENEGHEWNTDHQVLVYRDIEASTDTNKTSSGPGILTPPLADKVQGKSTGKKVKRSLKRPHTKEIQGSPSLKVKKETQDRPVYTGFDWPPVFVEEYINDNLKYLIDTEERTRVNSTIGWTARCCIVNWLVNVNGTTGNPAVVETTCWYIDSYLNKNTVSLEKLQLVAAACYWIASKINGVSVTSVTSTRLERWSGFAFTTEELLAMEIRVLRDLEFPRLIPVPHDFVPYLCCWCEDTTGALTASATFIALCVALVRKFGSECPPSVVACACVNCAIRLTGHDGIIPRLEECLIYKIAVRKARNFRAVCLMARNAVRTVTGSGFEYKAPYTKFSGPPHHVARTIAAAVNCPRVIRDDIRLKATFSSIVLG